MDVATNKLKSSMDYMWRSVKPADRVEVMKAMEQDDPHAAPVVQQYAGNAKTGAKMTAAINNMRQVLEQDRDELVSRGLLKTYLQNYFPHLWTDEDKARSVANDLIAEMEGKRPIGGSGGFLKKRTISDIQAGLDRGLTLKTDNPVEAVMLKHAEIQRYIRLQNIKEDALTTGLLQKFKPGDQPAGFARIQDPGFNAGEEAYYAPTHFAKQFNRFSSANLLDQNGAYRNYVKLTNGLNMMELGMSGFHLGLTAKNASDAYGALAIKQAADGDFGGAALSALNSVPGRALYAAKRSGSLIRNAWDNPELPGVKPEIQAAIDRLEAAGGRAHTDSLYSRTFGDNFKTAVAKNLPQLAQGDLGAGGKLAATALERTMTAPSRVIMEKVVADVKSGVFAAYAEHEAAQMAKEFPNGVPESVYNERLGKIWDLIDNRFGALTHDNLFWDRTVKGVFQTIVGRPGWNIGNVRMLVQGMANAPKLLKGDMTYETANLLQSAIGTAITGSLAYHLTNGLKPTASTLSHLAHNPLDMIAIPNNSNIDQNGHPTRFLLPDLTSTYVQLGHDPVNAATNAINPAAKLAYEWARNSDYRGVQVRSDKTPYGAINPFNLQNDKDFANHFLGYATPISAQNFSKYRDKGKSIGAAALLAGMAGTRPAPRWMTQTPAENMADDINNAQSGQNAITREEFNRRQAKGKLKQLYMQGDKKDFLAQGQQMIKDGLLSTAELQSIATKNQTTDIGSRVTNMSLSDIMRVYQKGNPDEKKALALKLKEKLDKAQNSSNPPTELVQMVKKLPPGVWEAARNDLTSNRDATASFGRLLNAMDDLKRQNDLKYQENINRAKTALMGLKK